MFLLLLELQAPNHLHGVLIGGLEEIRVEHLAWPQDLDVGQGELPPIILIGDGGIGGRQDGFFAGSHGCSHGMATRLRERRGERGVA